MACLENEGDGAWCGLELVVVKTSIGQRCQLLRKKSCDAVFTRKKSCDAVFTVFTELYFDHWPVRLSSKSIIMPGPEPELEPEPAAEPEPEPEPEMEYPPWLGYPITE